MVQLVIPMAGLGSRFASQGYPLPKPFLPIGGKTMLETVVENLYCDGLQKLVLVLREEHSNQFTSVLKKVEAFLGEKSVQLSVVLLSQLSEGPAHSVFLARHELELDAPLLIANSDQFVRGGVSDIYDSEALKKGQNAIYVIESNDPKWSFATLDARGFVYNVVEKEVVSNHATAGIYLFHSAKEFLGGFSRQVTKDDRTNNEFYVGPVFNYIESPTRCIYLGKDRQRFFGLGTPEDYEFFINQGVVTN